MSKYGHRTINWFEAIVNKLGGEEGAERFLSGAVEVVVKSALAFMATITLPATRGKLTSACFTKTSRWYHRDVDLDRWLPSEQSAHAGVRFRALQFTVSMTFKQMAEAILDVTGDIAALAQLLIEHGHTVTLEQIEMLVERTEAGEDVGLNTNGYANFFFVLNNDGSVSVVSVFRSPVFGRWGVSVFGLSRGARWLGEGPVFARNLDA